MKDNGNDGKAEAIQISPPPSLHKLLVNLGHRDEVIHSTFVSAVVEESKNGKVGFQDFTRILERTLNMDDIEGPSDTKVGGGC